MAYIKKLVMQGFKSFVRKTEIPFNQGINVVLGPNGSGKSNISDALCFVLGRLSIKSMRAAKAKNLIFMGNREINPAKEASVELIIDNSDKAFFIEKDEISIKRIVRKNGLSIYKINNETKTRQEVLSLLAQAGIDPNGYNIILQGEIQGFVKMHSEERRKIIEEVSGISVYEQRKEKSLKELQRTDEKLKEVGAILRERTSYLNNLEKERQQALKFKKLESQVKTLKASIINHDLKGKEKEVEAVNVNIDKKNSEIEKTRKNIITIQGEIESLKEKIKGINAQIEKSTGLEQESLNSQITDLKANLIGLQVNRENLEKKIYNSEKQIVELGKTIADFEIQMRNLKKEIGQTKLSSKEESLESKKKEYEKLEEKRKKYYTIKGELKSIKERIKDKSSVYERYKNEADFALRQLESLSSELYDKKTSLNEVEKRIELLKKELSHIKSTLDSSYIKEKELDRENTTAEHEINRLERLRKDISSMEVCPVCKNKITESHIHNIHDETSPIINSHSGKIEKNKKIMEELQKQVGKFLEQIGNITDEIKKREFDSAKLALIDDKKEQLKKAKENSSILEKELTELNKQNKNLEETLDSLQGIEQKYETIRVELQELSSLTSENVDSEIAYKQRELDRAKISLKQISREKEEFEEDMKELLASIEGKETQLEKKQREETSLAERFRKMFALRDSYNQVINDKEKSLITVQNQIHYIEQEINNLKIEKAKLDAQRTNYETELLDFPGVELITGNKDKMLEKLHETQEFLHKIGSVNLRSLEVYDEVKKEYDTVYGKVEILNKEKESIMKIVHEIDIKKRKAFLKTLQDLNEIFSRNFSQLSVKGQVNLELENKQDPFEGGIGISVKVGKGKYFDVTSLSGGEQTLVALSLIFAIQEYKPYYFYILDEIDAALDKRNSARLAQLLRKYMQKGQYIVITHNDEVITNATTLYGVSMHDGISKIVSLKI